MVAPGDAGSAADGSSAAPAGGRSLRLAFRRWRRSRPFWGGLLLTLAGVELFFIPLADVFMRGTLGVVMHMGMGGIAGVLIGGVLTVCGLLLWFQPEHKTFYAVIGVLGAVLSFPASNFGGFMLGMLLGITGGSLAFGWTDRSSASAGKRPRRLRPPSEPDRGVGLDLVVSKADEDTAADVASGEAGHQTGTSGGVTTRRAAKDAHRRGFRRASGRNPWRARSGAGPTLHAIASLFLFGPLLMPGPAGAAQASATGLGGDCRVIVICPEESPAVSAGPASSQDPPPTGAAETNEQWMRLAIDRLIAEGHPPDISRSAITKALEPAEKLSDAESALWKLAQRLLGSPPDLVPVLPPTPPPGLPSLPPVPVPLPPVPVPLPPVLPPLPPGLPGNPLPGSTLGAEDSSPDPLPPAAVTPGLEAYTAQVALSAGTAQVAQFAYEGVAQVPVAGGGTVKMMKFTAGSFTASDGVEGVIKHGSSATVITSPSLAFSGDIVIYATKFSAVLMGVPVTLTPGNAESRILQLLNSFTPSMPLTMTDVVANQPILLAESMQGRLAVAVN